MLIDRCGDYGGNDRFIYSFPGLEETLLRIVGQCHMLMRSNPCLSGEMFNIV